MFMFQKKELETIMKSFDIDLESAKYYQKHGDLPESILEERIIHYIHQYVIDIKCPIPRGLSLDFAHYLQLYIDQYPNLSEELKKEEVPSFVHDVIEKALTIDILRTYREKRMLDFARAMDYKREITLFVTSEMKKDTFSMIQILPLLEEKIQTKESYKTYAILDVLFSILDGFLARDILQKEEVEVVEEFFLKHQENILYYPDLHFLRQRNQIYKDHFQFLEQMEEINRHLRELTSLYAASVKKAPYQKKIGGITFASKSIKELAELISYYQEFIASSQSVNQRYFLNFIANKELFITNMAPPNPWSDEPNGPCFIRNSDIIYLDQRALSQYFGGVIYHEGEHFISSLLNNNNNSTVQEDLLKVLNSLRKNITKEDNKRFILDYQRDLKQWIDYVQTFKEDAKEVLKNDLLDSFSYPSDDLLEERFSQYAYEFANAKMYQNGYNSMFDIFDAIHKGGFSTAFPDYKVGHKDSFTSDDICCNEILAEISYLYNSGNIDMLIQYLPYEEVKSLIRIYENTVKMDFSRDYYVKHHQDSIKDLIDQNLLSIDSSNINDLASFTSYEVAGHYLEQAMKEYGEKEFIDLLIEYQMTGNLSLFHDEKIRRYISLLDDSHISMFLQGNLTGRDDLKKY